MKQVRYFQTDQGEEVLVSEVTLEVVLGSKLLHFLCGDKSLVCSARLHSFQIQQHNPAVEPGQAVWRGIADSGSLVLAAVERKHVAVHWLHLASHPNDVGACKAIKVVEQLLDVCHKLEVGVQHYDATDVTWENAAMDCNGQKEDNTLVVRIAVSDCFLKHGDKRGKLMSKLIDLNKIKLGKYMKR